MTDKEIFDKAVDKVYDNTGQAKLIKGAFLSMSKYLIFDHSFAKAFWGEETVYLHDNVPVDGLCSECYRKQSNKAVQFAKPAWQYHLQQMVLKEEPLKYLKRYL
jgi:hypothetical protein